jgi:hypothetical protein
MGLQLHICELGVFPSDFQQQPVQRQTMPIVQSLLYPLTANGYDNTGYDKLLKYGDQPSIG